MNKKIYNLIYAFCLSCGLFININLFKNTYIKDYSIFYSINSVGIFITFVTYYYFLEHFKQSKISLYKKILGIVFAIFVIIGECYVTDKSFLLIFKNILTIMMSFIKLVGFSSFFISLFSLLDKRIDTISNKEIKSKKKTVNKFLYYFDNYPFRTSFIIIFIVFSVYLIAFYPIVLSPDPSYQIKMFFNEHTKYIDWVIQRDPNVFMTAHHPVLQTFLIGYSIKLGRFLINDNFGLFIYTFFQTIIYVSVLAYSIKFLKNNNIKSKNRLIILLIYTLVPHYAFYSVSAVKDTLYTAFMFLFVLFVFDIVKNYKIKKISIKYAVYLYFIMLLLSLFRHNGVYVITISIIFLIFYSKKNMIRIIIPFIIFFSSVYAFDNIFVPSLGISGTSTREMLSVPFQQTARLIKKYPNFYNGQELEKIDYILDISNLAKRYNPELADPVKNKYNKYTINEDLVEYAKIWFKGLVKHPLIYIDATLNNTYGYIYPGKHNWYIYSKYDDRVTKNNLVDYHYNNLGDLRNILNVYGNIYPYLPIVGMLSNIAFNTWWILILSVYLFTKKHKKYLICLVPLYMSLVFCIIGPANTYFRYTMPYVFILPVLSVILLNTIKEEK